MSQPVVHYDGNYITCYPGSNQIDDGKLNMEFNMARFVTRLSSKNFCVVKPSFELKKVVGPTGKPQIEVGVGQASINGMDLIMSSTIIIDAPEEAGEYHLAFKLHRDSSKNVLGDDIYGVTKTFMGVYLTYFNEKPDPLTDMDMLYLGKVSFDGTNITEIVEDEDKYGRLWAEDILAKINDPKHPDIKRMILQDWIYAVPDWYISKEGDVTYGEIDFLAGRNSEGTYGIHIQATDDKHAEYIMKAPSLGTDEQNRILKFLANNNGIEASIGQSKLVSNTDNNFDLVLTTPNNISATSNKNINLIGKTGVVIGTGANGQQPRLEIKNHYAKLVDSAYSGLQDTVEFKKNSQNEVYLDHTIGKSILEYGSGNLSLLSTDTAFFNVFPKLNVLDQSLFQDTIYIGAGTFGSQGTWLKANEWNLKDGNNITNIKPGSQTITNSSNGSGYIKVRNTNDSAYGTLANNGSLTLYNSSVAPQIYLNDGSYNVTIKQTKGAKGDGTGNVSILDITAGHTKFSGDITATGEIRANKVYNAVYNGFGEIFRKPIDEKIEYGDVVCVREDGLVHKVASVNDINNIIGVCSNTIGIEMGGKDIPKEEQVEVEMVGQIWVKTDNEHIKCGQWVKALPNGKCDITTNRQDRLGITISTVIDNKVKVVYNG